MQHDDPTPETLARLEQAEQLKIECRHREAIALLEELLLEDPENVAALEEIADNELSLQEYERAEAAATRAVQLEEDSYTGEYILGFLRSQDEEWEKAVAHLRRANGLRPNNSEILRCLGWALFHLGQRAQGIVTLERALNLDSESPLTLCDLGVTYLETRDFNRAKALFQRSLDLDPENERARECMEAVKRLALTPQQKVPQK